MLRVFATVSLLFLAATAPAFAQDAENGADVFKKCTPCHRVGEGATNLVGPVLNGIVGRKVSAYPGFAYSEASKAVGAKGATWTAEELDKYLENPLQYMPGTKMAFAGVSDKDDRADLIAYLKTLK